MYWTTKRPTKEGWYWYQDHLCDGPIIGEVEKDGVNLAFDDKTEINFSFRAGEDARETGDSGEKWSSEPIELPTTPKVRVRKPRPTYKLAQIRLTNTVYPHFKVWEARLWSNGTVEAYYGKINGTLQKTITKNGGADYYYGKIREKLKEGYREVF